MPFYQTISLFGDNLKQAEEKTESQDKIILETFEKLQMPLSPSLVYNFLINRGKISRSTPITSIRRSITDLTKEGKLCKTGKQVKGPSGMPENQWKIA